VTEKIRVGEVLMTCGTCEEDIPVPVDVWIDGERLVPEARMADHRRWHSTLTNLPDATLDPFSILRNEESP
jgi:hypothetical protein